MKANSINKVKTQKNICNSYHKGMASLSSHTKNIEKSKQTILLKRKASGHEQVTQTQEEI